MSFDFSLSKSTLPKCIFRSLHFYIYDYAQADGLLLKHQIKFTKIKIINY